MHFTALDAPNSPPPPLTFNLQLELGVSDRYKRLHDDTKEWWWWFAKSTENTHSIASVDSVPSWAELGWAGLGFGVCPGGLSLNWLCKRLINWWIAMLKWQQFSAQHRQTKQRSIMWPRKGLKLELWLWLRLQLRDCSSSGGQWWHNSLVHQSLQSFSSSLHLSVCFVYSSLA